MEVRTNTSNEEPISFEKVWLLFQNTDLKFKETDVKFQEMRAESIRMGKRMERELKALKTLFTGQWGALVESLVEGKVVHLLQERGIDIKLTYTNVKDQNETMEFDIVAANGKDIVVVEVKTTFKLDDLEYFCEKLPKFRDLSENYSDKRILGAIAYLKADASIVRKAEKAGLFVIKATGESAKIINKVNFEPKTW